MKMKNSVGQILEDNQNEYFCQFCTKPKVATAPICSCSGNWFKLSDFDFDTQFSIASTLLNSQKGLPDQKID
jgi:ribosomal protein L37AE/L43A